MTLTSLGPKRDTMDRARIRVGNERSPSMTRCMPRSTHPPRKPLTSPKRAPIRAAHDDGDHRDKKDGAGSDDEAAELIAAKVIRAEQKRPAGPLEQIVVMRPLGDRRGAIRGPKAASTAATSTTTAPMAPKGFDRAVRSIMSETPQQRVTKPVSLRLNTVPPRHVPYRILGSNQLYKPSITRFNDRIMTANNVTIVWTVIHSRLKMASTIREPIPGSTKMSSTITAPANSVPACTPATGENWE